ncbi:MAG: bifunctional alpha/beta hydrolase/OsmC family protein [Bacteroidota bacterium]
MKHQKVHFTNQVGYELSARLELPVDQHPVAYAIFAHVFTGNKNLGATRHISRALTMDGIAVLRFDFTGLGDSQGEFEDTTFSSNVEDLLAAARFLEAHYEAPRILIGHSLGGAAVIFAAAQLPSVQALATLGAPSEPKHVQHLLKDKLEDIEKQGKARVSIGGREFTIKRAFLEDLNNKNMFKLLSELRKPLLVLHSPQDRVVEIENAATIYHAAFHPKSFVTLDGADHMLSRKEDAAYAGHVISTWARRYLPQQPEDPLKTHQQVVVRLDDAPGYTTEIKAGPHKLIADEPENVGGNNFGPDPYALLLASLGACTAMTLKMYAARKKWPLEEVTVHLNHFKKHKEDCIDCDNPKSRIDHFERIIELEGNLQESQMERLLDIANRCPVHRSLHKEVKIDTRIADKT